MMLIGSQTKSRTQATSAGKQ